jgi:(2Fe-2S) ferredoxin/predicted O-methyltransferase YrrM
MLEAAMQPFRYHVLACDQKKPDGLPCCGARGSAAVIDALRRELGARGLLGVVQVTVTGSLGLCERGPNLVVYPEGTWYSGVTPADVPELVSEHFEHGRPVGRWLNPDEAAVRQEITENRNRMLRALKARDAAGVVPDELMETIRGYQPSRILLSAIELDLFSAVATAGGDATAANVARALGSDPRTTETLLNALVALGVMHKREQVFANSPLASRFFTAGSPDDARVSLRHNLSLWSTWSKLTETVRTGHPAGWGEMAKRGEDWTVPFIAAMHKNAALRAPLVVQAVGTAGVRRLLDVGGGSGAYSIAFARANPELSADVFDLGTVVSIADQHIAEAGLGSRVRTRVGDLTRDAFGGGYDLLLLSAICHMLGPAENRDLLGRARDALFPGGRVVIQDHVMDEDKTAPRAGALFAINMLVGTPRGGTYSEAEYRSLLEDAGFSEVRRIRLPGPNDLMLGTRV